MTLFLLELLKNEMAKHGIIFTLHAVALCSCIYGIYRVAQNCARFVAFIYTGLWFATTGLESLAGILSIVFYYFDPNPNGLMMWSNYSLQYYYLLAWISCIIGYPSYVTSTWMHYYPNPIIHLFVASAILPMGCWMFRKDRLLTITTQLVIIVSAIAHMYISFLAENIYTFLGAALMFINLVLFSVPTSSKVAGLLSPKEAVTLSFTCTTYLLAEGLCRMGMNPEKRIESLYPW